MCTPAAMMAMTAIQGIRQYNATKQQASATAAMYNAQADAARQNAAISATKQSQIADQYARQQQKLDARMRLAAGQTAAQAGGSGLQLSGSPLDVLSSGYQAYHDDTNQLLSNQRNDVWSEYLNQVNYENQSNAYSTAAHNTVEQGNQAALGTLLGTAASMYGIYHNYGAAKTASTSTSIPAINPSVSSTGAIPAYSKTWGFADNQGIFSSTPSAYATGSGYNVTLPTAFNATIGQAQPTSNYLMDYNYVNPYGIIGKSQSNTYQQSMKVKYPWKIKIGG